MICSGGGFCGGFMAKGRVQIGPMLWVLLANAGTKNQPDASGKSSSGVQRAAFEVKSAGLRAAILRAIS